MPSEDDITGGVLERIFGCHEDAATLMDGILCPFKRDPRELSAPPHPHHEDTARGQLSLNQTLKLLGILALWTSSLQNYEK